MSRGYTGTPIGFEPAPLRTPEELETERNQAAIRVRARRRIRRVLGIPIPAGVPLAPLLKAAEAVEMLGWEETNA